MLCCHFKLPQEDVGVPQVAVSSSFCCAVTKFFRYEQALLDETDPEDNECAERRSRTYIYCKHEVWERCRTCS